MVRNVKNIYLHDQLIGEGYLHGYSAYCIHVHVFIPARPAKEYRLNIQDFFH